MTSAPSDRHKILQGRDRRIIPDPIMTQIMASDTLSRTSLGRDVDIYRAATNAQGVGLWSGTETKAGILGLSAMR